MSRIHEIEETWNNPDEVKATPVFGNSENLIVDVSRLEQRIQICTNCEVCGYCIATPTVVVHAEESPIKCIGAKWVTVDFIEFVKALQGFIKD